VMLALKFKNDLISVGRPVGAASRAMQRGQLSTIGAVAVAIPDLGISQAIRLKYDLLPVRGDVRAPIKSSSRRNHSGGKAGSTGFVLKVDSPDAVAEAKMFIRQKVPIARNGWVSRQIAYASNGRRYSSHRGHEPEIQRPSLVGGKDDFLTVLSPGRRGEPG